MVGRCTSYWNSPFLGDMLVFGGVYIYLFTIDMYVINLPCIFPYLEKMIQVDEIFFERMFSVNTLHLVISCKSNHHFL